jgi:hypothetical protein
MQFAALDHDAKRLARADKRSLASYFVERSWAHSLGKWRKGMD